MAGKWVYVAPKKTSVSQPGQWSEEKRIEAATVYLNCGNLSMTSRLTGIPRYTIKEWLDKDWWNQLLLDINKAKETDKKNKFSKLIDKSIELLENRLEEGDFQYDPKTGKMIRVPLKARDANRILNDAQQAVLNIDKESRKVEQQKKVEDIADRLTKIAQAFSNVRPKEIKGEVLDGYVTEKE